MKIKKLLVIIISIIIFPSTVYALDFPKTNSKIVEIYDLTDNKVLYEINSNKLTSIASLTKIMTTITAIENIKNIDEEVIITKDMLKEVSNDASRAGLKVGDKLTYKDLLYASILPSGADATISIAINSCKKIENFVDKMNALAKKINLKNTHFVNVTGLDEKNHYSTASDVRILLTYALKNKLFKEIYTTKKYKLSNGLIVKSTLYKYNTSLDTMNKILGSKTGFTNDAGYSLSSLSNINNHEIIIITLKAEHINNNYYNIIDTSNLINFLHKNYKDEILVKKNQLIKTIKVNLSNINTYDIKATKDIKKYLPSDFNKNDLKIEYDGIKELSYNNKKNSTIGTIKYYYKDELFFKEDVILNKKISLNIIKLLKRYIFFIVIFIILITFVIIKIIKNKKRYKCIKKME